MIFEYYSNIFSTRYTFCVLEIVSQAAFFYKGWKWSLWSMPAWLALQRSKSVIFLIWYDSINDIKQYPKCLYYTSAVPQPFVLLIAANLAQAEFLGWKWSLWPVPTWLTVQWSKAVFFLNLMIASMIWNTSELSASHHSLATFIFVVYYCYVMTL